MITGPLGETLVGKLDMSITGEQAHWMKYKTWSSKKKKKIAKGQGVSAAIQEQTNFRDIAFTLANITADNAFRHYKIPFSSRMGRQWNAPIASFFSSGFLSRQIQLVGLSRETMDKPVFLSFLLF